MRTWFLSLIVSVCLAIVLAGTGLSCKPKSPKETKAAKTEPNTPSEPNANKVAVTVNGVAITDGDVTALIEPQLEAIAKQSSQLPPAIAEQYKKQLWQQALEQLIRRDLLDQKIKQANITVTDEEVIAKIREIVSQPGKLLSLEETKKKVEQYGQNFDQLKEDVRKSLARNKFMEMQWAGKVNVTEEEARKYYDQNRKLFDIPEQIRASHILITFNTTDPNVDPNQAKAKAKAKAENLLKQLKNGADFAALAKAYSSCPSAPRGGDLGFFPRGKTTPAFEKAAFALKVGQISDVVETEYGFHIIKVTDHKDASVIPFEQAKANIIAQLTQKKESEFAEKYINSLKANAKIVFPSQS
jgi:peptidyl-prolyl cis-trans isomerase C